MASNDWGKDAKTVEDWGKDAKTVDDWAKGSKTISEPGYFQPGSMSESIVRGFGNAASFGMVPRISAGVSALMGGDYDTALKDYIAADRAARAANPMASLAASAIPTAIQAFATGGGSLLRQAGVNAAQGAAQAFGSSEKSGVELAKDVALGGTTGAAVAAVPGLTFKGTQMAADRITRPALAQAFSKLDDLIKNKPPGWQDDAAAMLGTTKDQMKRDGVTVKQTVKALKDELETKAPLNLTAADMPAVTRPMIKSVSPKLSQLSKEAGKTIAGAAVGAGLGAGANYATGTNIDPLLAAAGGATLGATQATQNLLGQTAKSAAARFATSPGMQNIPKTASGRAVGAATQMLAGATSRQVSDSPFGKLSDYVSLVRDSENPEVMAAAEQADAMGGELEEQRRIAMQLNSTAAGRAVGNMDSPLREVK